MRQRIRLSRWHNTYRLPLANQAPTGRHQIARGNALGQRNIQRTRSPVRAQSLPAAQFRFTITVPLVMTPRLPAGLLFNEISDFTITNVRRQPHTVDTCSHGGVKERDHCYHRNVSLQPTFPRTNQPSWIFGYPSIACAAHCPAIFLRNRLKCSGVIPKYEAIMYCGMRCNTFGRLLTNCW